MITRWIRSIKDELKHEFLKSPSMYAQRPIAQTIAVRGSAVLSTNTLPGKPPLMTACTGVYCRRPSNKCPTLTYSGKLSSLFTFLNIGEEARTSKLENVHRFDDHDV
jgi:hypothetical protein